MADLVWSSRIGFRPVRGGRRFSAHVPAGPAGDRIPVLIDSGDTDSAATQPVERFGSALTPGRELQLVRLQRGPVERQVGDVLCAMLVLVAAIRSRFLEGALAWIYPDGTPESCRQCGFDWSTSVIAALDEIERAPLCYANLLDGRDGMLPAADGGWNATAYVWHLTDLARSWTERWVQLSAMPGSRLVGWNPDELANARNYRALPTVAALWALSDAVSCLVEHSRSVGFEVSFEHGDWGDGTVGDGIRWLAHEFVHHQLDVDARASPLS